MGDFSGDSLTGVILGYAFRVHGKLGPGFVESIYKRALAVELGSEGLHVVVEKYIPIHYRGELVGRHFLDIVVDDRVIIEAKAVESICKPHYAQVRSYRKASGLKTGLIINFSADRLDYRRVEPLSRATPSPKKSPQSP